MKIVVVGAGGHGRVVLEIVRLAGKHEPVGFLDADVARAGAQVDGLPILGSVNLLPKLARQDIRGAVIAIGDNRVRLSHAALVLAAGLELVSAVHPAAIVSPLGRVGRSVVVAGGAFVGTAADVGDLAIINSLAVVDHECVIGRGVHICPGALLAGRVEVQEGAFVGLGAKVLPCLKVGRNATVGAGAVVTRDVAEGTTIVGVPARELPADRR